MYFCHRTKFQRELSSEAFSSYSSSPLLSWAARRGSSLSLHSEEVGAGQDGGTEGVGGDVGGVSGGVGDAGGAPGGDGDMSGIPGGVGDVGGVSSGDVGDAGGPHGGVGDTGGPHGGVGDAGGVGNDGLRRVHHAASYGDVLGHPPSCPPLPSLRSLV